MDYSKLEGKLLYHGSRIWQILKVDEDNKTMTVVRYDLDFDRQVLHKQPPMSIRLPQGAVDFLGKAAILDEDAMQGYVMGVFDYGANK